MSGLFVTVEGIDGSGKTSVVEAIEDEFDRVVTTSEPTDYNTGQLVRELLQDSHSNPITDFHAFMADRQKHIDTLIKPHLHDDYLVVSDRYADSTRAYQSLLLEGKVDNPSGYIRRVMKPWNVEPDLTLYLDVPPEVAIGRVDADEKYEKQTTLEAVYSNYRDIGEHYSDRWFTIDATRPLDEVIEQAISVIIGYRRERDA